MFFWSFSHFLVRDLHHFCIIFIRKLSFAHRVLTELLKAPLCFPPRVIPPAGFWMPLSKGTHREPHGRPIPPAKYQYTSQIYDIGTEILCKTCFRHNSTQNERTSMMFSGFRTEFYVHCESAINTRFKAFFKSASNLVLIADSESR